MEFKCRYSPIIYDAVHFFQRLDQSILTWIGAESVLVAVLNPDQLLPSKGLRIQGQVVKKPSISEDFGAPARMIMTIAHYYPREACRQSVYQIRRTSSTSDHSEFINHGLQLWNQTRLQWVGNKRSQSQGKVQDPVLSYSWNASYDGLLGTSKKFPQLIPLSEMVDFLGDIWEQEGLYD